MEQTAKRIIYTSPYGNAGNRALQYLTAQGIARRVPGAVIQNLSIPEWGLSTSAPLPPGRMVYTGMDRFWLDAQGLGDCLHRGVMDALVVEGYPYHTEHYPPREACRALLGPMQNCGEAEIFGAGTLVCSVRADEILRDIHPNYYVLPPGCYAKLAEISGLKLVFYGQLGTDAYSASLRAAFPNARFIQSTSVAHDFEVLRRCRNLALSISTFAWLAGWLGTADRIYLPVGGVFNPLQEGNLGFLPVEDPAYRFMLLPLAKAVNLFAEPERFFHKQARIAAEAQPITKEEVIYITTLARHLQPFGPYVGGFDPVFYVEQAGPDTAANPLEHYLRLGCRQHRQPVRVDPEFYLAIHPQAAASIKAGRFQSALHHYVAEGWKHGLAPTPE